MSFTNRCFHLSGPPGFGMAFHAARGMEDLTAFSVREAKRVAAETSIPLQKDSASESKRQSHSSKLSEN